jgi:hypothetical protein
MPADPLRLAALMADALPAPDAPGWDAAMRQAITRGHLAVWMAGTAERLGVPLNSPLLSRARLSRAERAEIKAVGEKQLDYLKGFQEARLDMSEQAIAARSSMYPGALKATYYGARWGEWEIPEGLMPGMQQCLTRCLCKIHVVEGDGEDGTLVREMGGTEHHCEECPDLAGEHPIKRRREE